MQAHLSQGRCAPPTQTRSPPQPTRSFKPFLHHHRFQQLHVPSAAQSAPSPPQQNPGTRPVYLQDSKTLRFLDQATKELGIKNKLLPAEFGGLRGMCTLEKSEEGQVLVSVPRRSSITLAPKQRCPFPDWINSDYWQSAPWFVKLGLLLLNERNQGDSSRLSSYMEQLPKSFDIPVLWSDQAREQLQVPAMIKQVKEQQREWDTLYQELCTKGIRPGGKPVSKQDFTWALCAVRSRTFSSPYIGSMLGDRLRLGVLVGFLATANIGLGLADTQRTLSAALAVFLFNIIYEVVLSRSLRQYAICPVIDFINHSSREQSEVSYDYFLDSYTVAASKPYERGEQVFISYGIQTNDSLLQFYGFVEPDNPNDNYIMTIMLKWVESKARLDHGRLQALEKAGLLPSLQQVTLARTGFPADTLQALRYLLAPDAEASKGPSAFGASASAETEGQLAEMLVHACSSELASLGTSLADDQAMLSNPKATREMPAPQRLAVMYRCEKKKILSSCLKALTS